MKKGDALMNRRAFLSWLTLAAGLGIAGCVAQEPPSTPSAPSAAPPEPPANKIPIVTEEKKMERTQAVTPPPGREIATLAGGCFWCTEAIFDQLKGVESVESGYSGGQVANPTYKEVCNGATGHAEAIQITFDPKVISYRELLEVFLTTHDPTTLNRQGNDVGTQYRSAIFTHSEEQKRVAQEVIQEFNQKRIWPNPIVTEVTPFTNFYVAEDYHQEYFANNGGQPYCRFVIEPKVVKFREKHRDKLKK
jgi:peptide-methionine (S)-S-oxide reductase